MIENAECVAIDLLIKTNIKFCFVCIYMLPAATSNAEIVNRICTILHNYLQVCYPIYIVDDFNLPTDFNLSVGIYRVVEVEKITTYL